MTIGPVPPAEALDSKTEESSLSCLRIASFFQPFLRGVGGWLGGVGSGGARVWGRVFLKLLVEHITLP